MRRVVMRVVLCGLCFLLVSMSNGYAAGFGLFADLGGGSGEAEWDDDVDSFDIDFANAGFGFVLDTGPTSPRVFSYRLLAGFEAQTLEDDFGVEVDVAGAMVENVFAFGLVKQPNFRLWAGPLVRVGVYSGESDTYVSSSLPGYAERIELDSVWEFGLGGALGANFRIARHMILAPTIGFRFLGGGGEGETYLIETSSGNTSVYRDDLSFGVATAFINLSLLFE